MYAFFNVCVLRQDTYINSKVQMDLYIKFILIYITTNPDFIGVQYKLVNFFWNVVLFLVLFLNETVIIVSFCQLLQ